MSVESGYNVAVVIVNRHEPEGETSGRLLELAEEKGYSPRVVEAQRGEHDAALSFRVPEDVAEAFNGERAKLWPADKIENDDEDVADVGNDAYAADQARAAKAARAENAQTAEEKTTTTPARESRTGKAKE